LGQDVSCQNTNQQQQSLVAAQQESVNGESIPVVENADHMPASVVLGTFGGVDGFHAELGKIGDVEQGGNRESTSLAANDAGCCVCS
jgi:hypothetical protein